jgi:hypothetical protein
MAKGHIRKAAGSYGVSDILFRQPGRLFGPPKEDAGRPDIEAVRNGEARLVSCFLSGEVHPYPREPKQGNLVLSGTKATWSPFWSRNRPKLEFDAVIESLEPRSPDKRRHQHQFGVVSIETQAGRIDLMVPKVDAPLVLDVFQRRRIIQND